MRRLFVVVLALGLVAGATASTAPPALQLNRIVATRQGDLLRLRIELKREWKSKILRGSTNQLRVLYGVNADAKPDYVGRIIYRGGLVELITGRDSAFEPVPVSRPSLTAARFTHPVDVMFPDPSRPGTIRIAVVSVSGDKADRLPRTGWFTVPPPPTR